MKRDGYLASLLIAVFAMFSASHVLAIDAVANDPDNTAHWHTSEKTQTVTFLGGDKPESAVLLLDKAAVFGRAVTVNSDGSYIIVQSGKSASPHIVFQIPPNSDGSITKFLLMGGDQPSLFLNDKELIQQQGKWIQICSTADANIRLEIGTATFAKVSFDPPLEAKATAPAHPAPAVPVAPAKDLLHPITARQLQLASTNFHEGVLKKCLTCSGTGWVGVQYQTGTRDMAGMSYPVYSTRQERCSRCAGSGIDRSSDETLIRLSGLLVKDMALLNEADPKKQETLTKVYSEITDRMIGDQKTWTLLTANGKSILAQRDPVPGTTVVALVQVKQSIKQDDDHRRYLVRVLGTDKEVYVDDPTLADELKSGHALMGGLVDKPLPNPSGEGHTTVLHGGFLIAPEITRDWWWWYKDRD